MSSARALAYQCPSAIEQSTLVLLHAAHHEMANYSEYHLTNPLPGTYLNAEDRSYVKNDLGCLRALAP